jgi:ABC-type transporter Mla subunit MlaD
MAIPAVRPASGVWSHTDPQKCVAVLRAQRETLHGENAAWRKRLDQAEAESASLTAELDRLREDLRDTAKRWASHAHETGVIASGLVSAPAHWAWANARADAFSECATFLERLLAPDTAREGREP